MKKMYALILTTMVVVPLSLLNCSDDDAKTLAETFDYFGTAAPGDAWFISGNPATKTFTMDWDHGTSLNTADDITIKGTYVDLPNGAYKLTITEVTPAELSIPTDGSAILYGLEIPHTAIILNPAGSIADKPMITMSVRNRDALKGAGGDFDFNLLRTAYPKGGYNHINAQTCWGLVSARIDEAAGYGYTLGGNEYSLSCAEHDINPSITCQGTLSVTGSTTTPAMKINADGSLEQINGIDTRKFTGQLSGDLMVMDNGEGAGGMLLIKKNASLSLADFSDGLPSFLGLSSSYDRKESKITESFLKMQFVSTDSATIKQVTDFENDVLSGGPVAAIKIKSVSNGVMKGYLYLIGNSLPRMPFVALGYHEGTKRLFSFVSGQLTPGDPSQGDQVVAHFITR